MSTRVMQPLQWAFPSVPVDREVLSREPAQPSARPPLLFVHGACHGAWCWQDWMDAAAERGWASHAVSLRGHGASGGHAQIGRWKLRDYTHDVMQAVADLPAQPVLVGHSMGALVVRRVLARYRAPAAVLLAPAGARHGLGIAARHLSRHPATPARLLTMRPVRLHTDDLFAGPDPAAAAVARRLTPESPYAAWEIILPLPRPAASRSPVLVLHGGSDPLVGPVEGVRTARAYGTRARLFAGMGHDLMVEAGWRAPLGVMLDWLEQTLTAAPRPGHVTTATG